MQEQQLQQELVRAQAELRAAEERALVLEKIISRLASRLVGLGGRLVVPDEDMARWHPKLIISKEERGYLVAHEPVKMVPTGRQS